MALLYKDVKPGDILVVDGGFTCMKAGEHKKVYRRHDGDLFVLCEEGSHCLDGQVDFPPAMGGEAILVGMEKIVSN